MPKVSSNSPNRIPIRSAVFDGGGTSAGQTAVTALGNMTREWVIYLQNRNAPVTIVDTTLNGVGPTTLTADAPTGEGFLLCQIIRQGTQGCQILWDKAVFQNAPVDIDVTVSTESLVMWLGHNGYWLYLFNWTGQPLSK
jgi:hypothetical protein